MLEVVLDHIVGQPLERLGCHGSPGDVAQVVVAPQQRELHPVVVRSLQEAFLQRRAEVFVARHLGFVVEIPVEDEDVEAVVGRRVDFLLHHLGAILVPVAPCRDFRLLVSVEHRLGPLQ